MIEPPDLPIHTIIARIRDRFGVGAEDAALLPVGDDASAWWFPLDGQGKRWFLKIFGRQVGYGDIPIDPALIAYYRYEWVLQELADRHRRVFDTSVGERTREEALERFVQLFEPDDVVAAAYGADREISG
jgi:hypothetical protein